LIEGVAEGTSQIVKIFSGAISDYIGRRKVMLLAGYGLAALSKPLFPLAGSAGTVFTARFLDRFGKGIRGAPRDALIADITPPAIRGASYGLRQAMDSVGSVLGPALAIALMVLFRNDIPRVMWYALLPAVLCFALIVIAVREPAHENAGHPLRSPIHPRELRRFSSAYWWVVVLGAVFSLSRFSEAFLILRGQQSGLSLTWAPLVMVVMSASYALSAYPAGKRSDRTPRTTMLGISLVPLILAHIVLVRTETVMALLSGVALWGLHMGFSQGTLSALVADATPRNLKGTAFGVFNLVCGVAMIPSNWLAGWLWQAHGAPTAFYVGAALATATLVLLVLTRHRSRPQTG
jgi:MFS family permease